MGEVPLYMSAVMVVSEVSSRCVTPSVWRQEALMGKSQCRFLACADQQCRSVSSFEQWRFLKYCARRPEGTVQGHPAHKKQPPPQDHHRTLGVGLL